MWCRYVFRVALAALLARSVGAQVSDTVHHAPVTTLRGVVRDSIARAPLAGAWVQLAAADSLERFVRTVASDSLGRFTIDSVPAGRYALGFFHPMLDSLGLEPMFREVLVDANRPAHADLAIPSPARLRVLICGRDSAAGAVVIGVVRAAEGRAPAAGAKVVGEWLEYTFQRGGISRARSRRVSTTAANGWFSMCNVPSGGTLVLSASRGADTTDFIEVPVSNSGFQRRELYLGAAHTIVTADTTSRADTLVRVPRRLRVGDGRLSGVVVTAEGRRPLPGALVRILEGPMALANERGEWTLANLPAGTRVLEVRAVGYYPERRSVDVVDGEPPVQVPLLTFRAMLDTVRITAERLTDRRDSRFDERRRTGLGRFVSAADLAKRGFVDASEIFRHIPGLRVEGGRVFMRSAFKSSDTGVGEDEYACSPMFYVNGLPMFDLDTDFLDNMLRAKNVKGIEVYDEANVPPQFQRAMGGCGSIIIWTK